MFTIELLPLEKDLLATIKFEALTLDGADDARRNGEAVCALMRALIARKVTTHP